MKKILSMPVFLLLVCILAYGIQAVRLGFYLDDWVGLYHIYRGGFERLASYFFGVNRPVGVWTWWLGYRLLGYAPLGWQLWSMLWRWLAAVFFWLALRGVWPEKELQLSLAAALFAIYPIFLEQSNALTFSHHWICDALIGLSLALMVIALKSRGAQRKTPFLPLWSVLLTIGALLASALQLVTIEYFAGIELVRPLLIWFHFRCAPGWKERLKQTVLHEAPYALVFAGFAVWRLVLMPTPGADRNVPSALYGLVRSPLATLPEFITRAFQDLVEAAVATWYKTYQPSTITYAPPANLLSWGIVLLAFGLALGFCLIIDRRYKEVVPHPGGSTADGELLALGLALLVAGFLPAWAIGGHLVSAGNYSDRFGLAAMGGASLLLVGAASLLLRRKTLILFSCLLIGLGAGYQFRLANNFRWSWERQARLSWQLRWRMPGITKNTALYGDGTLTSGSWVDIAWINFLYARPSEAPGEDYWYYDLDKFQDGGVPKSGQPVSEQRFERLSYRGNTSNSIVIQFKGAANQCVWVIDSHGAGFGTQEALGPYLDARVKSALGLSNLDRILPTAETNPHLTEIYPPESARDWCYYFEKASLAVQQKQWQVVGDLWQQAQAAHLQTGVAAEYLPFIYGIAQGGDIPTALDISRRAKSLDVHARESICQTWKVLIKSAPVETARVKKEMEEEYQCGWNR